MTIRNVYLLNGYWTQKLDLNEKSPILSQINRQYL